MSQMPTLRSVTRLRLALEDRLERVLKRAITIRNELASSRLQEGSEEQRELIHEQGDLRSAEMITRKAIAEISRRDTDEEARVHEASVQIFIAEAERQHFRTQAQWQQIGDYRNARLYRMQHLDLRLRVEQEFGLTGIPRQ